MFWTTSVATSPLTSTQVLPSSAASFAYTAQQVFDDGKTAYNTLKNRQDNQCWREAFSALDSNCKNFKLQDKQRLALQLTHCHLKDASRPSTRCNQAKDVYGCLASIRDDTSFNSYTSFFISVDSICHFLEADIWQQQTEILIQDLDKVSKTSLGVHNQVLNGNGIILDQTVQINTLLANLQQEADASRSVIDDLQQELQGHALASAAAHSNTRAQAEELMYAIDSLYRFASSIQTGWKTATATSYMLFSLNVAWLATTIPALSTARAWLFLLIVTSTIMEVVYSDSYTVRLMTMLLAGCVLLVHCKVYKRAPNGSMITKMVKQDDQRALYSRKQLVEMAKKHGISGNKKSVEIIEELKKINV